MKKRRQRLYQSIDETWTDSSSEKILTKPELPRRLFVANSKRYMHNVVGPDGSIQIMQVSEAVHKKIIASMEGSE